MNNTTMSPRSKAVVRSFLLSHDDCALKRQQEQQGGIRQLLDIIMKDYILVPRSCVPPAADDAKKKINLPTRILSCCGGGNNATKSKTPAPLLSGISPFSQIPEKDEKAGQHEEKANKRSLLCPHHGHSTAGPTMTASKKRRIGGGRNITTPSATDALSSSVWKTFPRLTAKAVELISASSKSSSRESLKHQLRTNELPWTEEMTVLAMLGRSLLARGGSSTTTTRPTSTATPAASKPAQAVRKPTPSRPPPALPATPSRQLSLSAAASGFYAPAAAGPATALLQGALADYFKLSSVLAAPSSPAVPAPHGGVTTTKKSAGDALLEKMFSSTKHHPTTTTAPMGHDGAGGRHVHHNQPGDREIMELLRVAAHLSPTNNGSPSTS